MALVLFFSCVGDAEQELGPPPSVDEAANTLMTRLGFLLGEKVTEVQPGPQFSMEVQDENQVPPQKPSYSRSRAGHQPNAACERALIC